MGSLREAAAAASARAAPASAAAYLRRALRERCDREQRTELLLELGSRRAPLASRTRSMRCARRQLWHRRPELRVRVRVALVLAPALGWAGRSADVLNRAAEAGEEEAEALRGVRLLISLMSVDGRRTTIDEAKRAVSTAIALREQAPPARARRRGA